MEVILKQDVVGLGYKNDTVKVKPGYGRNYLIPQGIAVIANNANKKNVEENIRQAAHKAAKLKQDAQSLAERMGDLTIEIATKAGETGKIFGAITQLQISDALKAKGFDVDRRKVALGQSIKELGDYKAIIDLHKEVKKEIAVKVIAE